MSDHGIVTEPGTIRFERMLPGPIERVWAFLTESDKRAKWLAGGPMELKSGGQVELTWHNSSLSSAREETPAKYVADEGATTRGHVTRCEEPRLLSYTWQEGGDSNSEVTFELKPNDELVQLILTHRRLKDRAASLGVAAGWHTHLGVLADQLAGRETRAFWRSFAQAEAEYDRRLAPA